MIVPLVPFLADLHRISGIAGVFLKILLRQPALYARTSFISFYESDGNVERLMHGAGEEIASGRKLTNGLGRALPPLALGIVLRFCAHHAWNLHRAHALMVGSVDDHLVVILHRAHPEALDGHLHVRLSCADPYLTCYDILDGQRLAIVEGNRQWLVAGLGRLDFHQPFPLLVSFRADSLFAP